MNDFPHLYELDQIKRFNNKDFLAMELSSDWIVPSEDSLHLMHLMSHVSGDFERTVIYDDAIKSAYNLHIAYKSMRSIFQLLSNDYLRITERLLHNRETGYNLNIAYWDFVPNYYEFSKFSRIFPPNQTFIGECNYNHSNAKNLPKFIYLFLFLYKIENEVHNSSLVLYYMETAIRNLLTAFAKAGK